MVRLVSPCIFNVVCVWYSFIGCLVIVHGCGTHAFAGSSYEQILHNFSHAYVSHVCLSVTHSLVTHGDSSRFNMVCPLLGQRYKLY